ncbi:histidinol-phosphatase HisJ [Clostridium butyricum]|uniref:histidinol-phosphatase HisJ n=1 Tax=Clostridium butyricum TaxID=1492 RepID=UPI0032BFD943
MTEKNMRLRDGHIHSPFCPHGTSDSLESYVEEALKHNLVEISFTEHMPFPCYFIDDRKFQDECATPKDRMNDYFYAVSKIKEKYEDKIKINLGMEVDFIDGLEEKTIGLLNEYGPSMEDGILSVHFIKIGEEYTAIDWKEGFEKALTYYGSVEKVYDKYYETLLKAVKYDLGEYRPKRIGHPNLIRIFNKLYPIEYENYDLLEELAEAIKSRDYEVDVNTAGLRKPYCGEVYVSNVFKDLVDRYEIRKVYGSDSHTSKDVARDFDKE